MFRSLCYHLPSRDVAHKLTLINHGAAITAQPESERRRYTFKLTSNLRRKQIYDQDGISYDFG